MLVNTKTMQRGDHRFRQTGNMVATAWMDTKVVTAVSTQYNPQETVYVDRKKKNGTIIQVSCPKTIQQYNTYMGGVDKGDQLRNYFKVRLKCRKYYKYIFWFLFDTAVTNAYIMSKYVPASIEKRCTENLKSFRVALAKQLIGNYMSRKRAGRPRLHSEPPPTLPRLEHLPSHSGGRGMRCQYCKTKRTPPRRRESVWVCNGCPGTPHLCLSGDSNCGISSPLW